LTGPNPTDRGNKGSKIHLICNRHGLLISLGISAANTHDGLALQRLVLPAPRGRLKAPDDRRPGYDSAVDNGKTER
jgi:hypothetical protein